MFIGHFAVGLASKKISNSLSLAMMFIAVQFLDIIWPIFVLLGIETVRIEEGITKLTPLDFTYYPYSHSLLMAIVWGLVLGLIYFLVTRNRQNSLIVGVLVLSHWVLDLLVHRPDLPLSPFSEYKVGFGMWNYPIIEIIIETGMFCVGIYFYYTTKPPKKKIAFWSLIGLLFIVQMMNFFGPLPPNVDSIAWGANMIWIFVIWAWWLERENKKPSLATKTS
ncbi:MAG: membrane-bound metal-dependent hydrolase YbcI (DUF457 family) [Cyclobacteriaceae bacterium]|jgi:membrane-bound metal-dependent hydrolase YbcI (DUF457 family)